MSGLLSLLIFLPLLTGLVLLLVPSGRAIVFRWSALITAFIQTLVSLGLWFSYENRPVTELADAFQFVEKIPWIEWVIGNAVLRVEYHVGVDGMSLPLVVLSTIIMIIAVLSSWKVQKNPKGYFLLLLLLNSSIIGCFVALDFFLFYLFFEFMLLPMFFLIGIWGGPNRQYASVKFFIYTLVGSLCILIVMIGLYQSVQVDGNSTFNLVGMMDLPNFKEGSVLAFDSTQTLWGMSFRYWAFVLVFVGFIIKLPAVPFHTWLPDAHVEASTPVSVVLAALLLKVGGYGLFRIAFSIFPDIAIDNAQMMALVGLISILYGGMNALAQNDLKRLVAYSSVSHMGFVILGLVSFTAVGFSGAMFQMVSHGVLSGALFLLVGVIYERTGNRKIENFSGLAAKLPVYTFFAGLFFFASLGLPGLSGFVGELLTLIGTFQTELVSGWVGPVAILGILISAGYFLWTMQRMFFGKYWVREESWQDALVDLNRREWIMFSVLGAFALLLGIFPSVLTGPVEESINFWTGHFQLLQTP